MNFAGPFDSELSHDSPVSLGGERFSFDSKPGFVQHHPSDSHVVVPDAHLLFSGDYTRIGSDLIISGDGQKFVVGNYFKGETRPALTSKDGATLAGHIVDALTGHVHYAQATAAAPAAAEVIGHVLKMTGSASVIRNGVSVELQIGAAVQKGDVIQTGSDSSIGLTFVDGSAFGMTANARMVLNEMIYDPNGSSNSSLISLVQGTITFVAGQTAKNGNMRVETPVATMGIRGTAVLVEIGANDGPTKFSVLVEPDGHTGSYNLYDKVTGQLIGTVSQAGQVTFVSSLGIGQPPTAIEQLKTLADQQAEKAIIQQVFQLYFPNYNPDDSNPKTPKFGSNTSGNNLAEILFTTNSNNKQTFLTQVELRFAVTDPLTGITTYQNRIIYNTKAVFSATAVLSSQAFESTVESFKISDLVHIDDPDIGNAPFYDTPTPFVAGSAIIKSAVSTNTNLSADFLSQFLHIDQNTGVITFDRLGFNFLGVGESVTFMIQVTSQSGPDVANVIIPVTITGSNDVPNDDGVPNGAPTIVLSLSAVIGAVKEDTLITPDHAIVSDGTITFRDVDLTDGHQATVVFESSTSGSTLDPISNPSLPGFGPNAEIGTFTIGPVVEDKTDTINTGTLGWHFTLDDNDETLQSLAEGQTITQVYTITITDEYGAYVTQTVTITITGTNDAPVLTADTAAVHQAAEIVNSTNSSVDDVVSGTLTFVDLDLTDTHQATATLSSAAGAVTWSGGANSGIPSATIAALDGAMSAIVSENNADTNNQGSLTWEFKLPDYLFDFLGHDETLTLVYDVKVADYNNGVATGTYSIQQVTVQVTANNDRPVVTSITPGGTVQEDIAVATGDLLKFGGSTAFTDADLNDTHTVQATYVGAVASSGASVTTGLAAALAAGALSVPSTVLSAATHTFNWDFALDNSLVQYLAAGETVTATYTINVTDNSGVTSNNASVAQTVTITITGTNDAPVIAADMSGTAGTNVHDIFETDAGLITSGTLAVTDVDLSNTVVASVHAVDISGTGTGSVPLALDNAALKAMLSVDAGNVIDNAHTAGTIHWGFDSGTQPFDFLADGETLVLTYTIRAADSDSSHATSDQTVVVKITGTNDVPVIGAELLTGAVTEDATPPAQTGNETATGTIAFSDADLTDSHTVSSIFKSTDYSGQLGSLTAVKTTDTSNGTGGLITWTFIATDAAMNHLAQGQVVHEIYTVTLDDGHGGLITRDIVITINGANDAPVVTGAVSDAFVVEDGAVSVLNALANASDVDNGTILSVVNLPGTLPAGVTYNAADRTFTLDPGVGAYQHLGEAQTTTVMVSYDVSDGITTTPASVSWIITGKNDAPTVSAALTDTASEGAAGFTKNLLLNASDVDDGDTLSVVNLSYKVDGGTASGTAPAGISLSGNTLSVNPANPSFNHLAVGAHTTIEVSYDVKDVLGLTVHQTETVTINGTNDSPIVTAALTDTVNEGAAAFTKDLLLGASDPDAGETATLHITDVTYKVNNDAPSAVIPAGLSLGADGHTLTIDPANSAFNHLAVGQHATIKVSYDVTDAQGATVDQTETITINGTNDAPHISTANITLTPQAFGATKVSGLSVTDVDNGGGGQFTLTTVADHGSIAPHVSTGSLSAINAALQTNLVYTPTDSSPIGHGTLTVTDDQGAFDVVNFVFRQSGSSPLILAENANQKDVLIGGSGLDRFVFTEHSGQDTVLNFTHGIDKIDFQAISSIDSLALTALLAQADHTGGNTLLHLNGTTDTVLLKGVATLNANDFILHT